MKVSRQFAVGIAIFILRLLPAFADDVITNVMSPVVSYQCYDALGEDTNSSIVSPIVSYQYFDSLNAGSVNFLNSPSVSYYYPTLDEPLLNIVQTFRAPTTAESTILFILPPFLPQLETFVGGSSGSFTANPPLPLDPNQMTIVLSHGWIPLDPRNGTPLFAKSGVEGWPTDMAKALRADGITANIVAWNWTNAAMSSVLNPQQAGSQSTNGLMLGQELLKELGANYSKQIHFIGHSFGTLVNGYAANFLQGNKWAATEAVSSTPWPGTNMLMTLFDEAEVGADPDKNFSLRVSDIENWFALAVALAGGNGNYLNSASPYYHPLPKQFAWAENYVSAFGLLHTNAANVILTDGFPTDAPDIKSWFYELGAFHSYPISWYEPTIQSYNSQMGFVWAYLWSLDDPAFADAPTNGSVYVQADNNSPYNLTQTTWNYGTNYQYQRFQFYRNGLGSSTAQVADNTITANGPTLAQALWDIATGNPEWLVSLSTTVFNSVSSQARVHPLGSPSGNGSGANVPAYAWIPLIIPTNAASMSFNYLIQGNWKSDSLAAAFNGTNVLLIAGNVIKTNVTFSSGSIDVSDFAGQTNEFFIGIVGGTSTNAQLTIENLSFSISAPPLLQVQASGNNYVLTWPLSGADYVLQTTTNLADPNSWMALTNVPAIVTLQNTVTNLASNGARFYRLMK